MMGEAKKGRGRPLDGDADPAGGTGGGRNRRGERVAGRIAAQDGDARAGRAHLAGKARDGQPRPHRTGGESSAREGESGRQEASPAGGRPSRKMAPSDQPQRIKAASSLEENFLVEAGAGTGKTALLMERLRHIILSGDVSMEQIVAITFTDKAAGELRSRFREELEGWAAEAEGREGQSIRDALRDIDRATICTIHSFCLGLLMERPVEAGVDPGFGVADEVQRETLFEAAWEQWLQEKMVPSNRRLKTAFLLGATLESVESLARALLNVRDMLCRIPGAVGVPDPGRLAGRALEAAASIRDLMKIGLRNPDDGIASEVGTIERALEWAKDGYAGEDSTRLAASLVSLQLRKKAGALKNWLTKETCLRARDVLSEIREELEEFRNALLHNAAVGLAEELRDFVEIYGRVKRERGVLDFDDLLIGARDLLRDSEEARSYFKRKYKFILIDEFQDTDPLQAEVAFFLAEELLDHEGKWDEVRLKQGKLFLVGDPKQSIYRFRRADIDVYERSKRSLCRHGSVLHIYVNFRSTRGVIDPVNLTFDGLARGPEGGGYQPDYVPLEAFRGGEAPGVVALTPGGPLPEDCAADEKRAFEASAIAWLVKDAVEKSRWRIFDKEARSDRPVRYADIAVLFRATTGLEIYEEAFRAWEIPYRVAGGKAFYSRQETQALVSVLTAVEHPHDAVAVVGALRSPFFGLPDDEIFLHWAGHRSLNYEEVEASGEVGRAFAALGELRRLRNNLPLVVFMDRLFEMTGALPAFYIRPHGEQRVANLLKISAMAARLEEAGPLTFKRFVRWTAEQGERGLEEGESPVREAGDDFASVLTIHKAKGLEFPVVILPGLWAGGSSRSESVVVDRGSGGLEINLSKSSGIATMGWAAMWDREGRILDAERLRLLYVAMTRARDKLVLPCLFGLDGPNEDARGGAERSHLPHLRPLIDAALSGKSPWAEVIEVPASGLEHRREAALRVAWQEAPSGAGAGGGTDYKAPERLWKSSLEDSIARAARAEPIAHPTGLAPELVLGRSAEVPSAVRTHAPGKLPDVGEGPPGPATSGGREVGGPGAGPEGFPRQAVELESGVAGSGRYSDVGRRIGKLVHRLLEIFDPGDLAGLESIARAFGGDIGLGPAAIQSALDMTRGFYESPLARRIRAARRVYREVPFCVRITDLAERVGRAARAGGIIVEGVADLLMEEPDGWRVVDFKTDRVEEAGVAKRAERYRLQGACYALCLSSVLGGPVKESIFYFLYPQALHVFAADEAFLQDARIALSQELAAAV
jgi:ATP-dependent helicase/nuclease subunit A